MKKFEGFKVKKAKDDAINGTSLQGYIDATFEYLLKTFGEPEYGSGDGKVQAEWELEINGVVVTIYDYKEYETPMEQVTRWHIGGKDEEAVEQLKNLMLKHGDPVCVRSVRVASW